MITDGKKWHDLEVKSLSALLRRKHQIMMETFIV